MQSKRLVIFGAAALVLQAGCSAGRAAIDAGGSAGDGGHDARPGDDRLFVPADLPNANQDGQDEGLVLVAFTLAPGTAGPSFFAAVQNVWPTPLCEAGMMVGFYDQSGQLVGSGASTLQSGRFYQLSDGTVIPCVDPGQIAMTGEVGLPDTIVVDQLGSLQHLFPSFNVDVVPVGGLVVTGVQPIVTATGTAYAGTVLNQIGTTVTTPSVAVFPVNRVGRPLGMATAGAATDLPAGATWAFQTNTVDDPGVDQVAFASGSVP